MADKAFSEFIGLKVHPSERRLLETVASSTGRTLSGFVRDAAVALARLRLERGPAPPKEGAR